MSGYNSNNTTHSPCISDKPWGVQEPKASFTIRVILMALILLLALVGNIMVYRGASRKPNRPFSYNLICNLALAEIVLTVTFPFVLHYSSEPWSWVFGLFMCKLINPLVVCSTLVITFTLAVIAAYRCLVLVQLRKCPSKRTAYFLIGFSWIWGIALSMPSSITRKIFKMEVCGPKILLRCREHFPDKNMEHNYTIALFVPQFVVPFVIMVLSYSIVIVKVKKHIRSAREDHDNREQSISLSIHGRHPGKGDVTCSTGNDRRRESSRISQLESDLLRMLYVIILVFFLCYLPSHIVFISKQLEWFSLDKWKYNFILNRYTDLLHALPSALHPICYGSMSKVIICSFRR